MPFEVQDHKFLQVPINSKVIRKITNILCFIYSAFRLEVAQSAAGPDLAFRAFLHYTYYVLK